ncbi:MAG: hypothetical protein CFE37_08035 [Alphaproteobacteria bacterium PA4]|nr:MAG: hypothetical protein CFE37_08035 [Alphaproteobacteria bacterium PA4]
MKSNDPISGKRRAGRPSVDRRDEILDAAERLYDAIGFDKTTIGDVARELGMSPANLYRFFANRQAIDEAVAARQLRLIEDAAWAEARRAHLDPEAAFRQLCVAVSLKTRDLLLESGRASELCLAATRGKWQPVRAYMGTLHGAVRHVLSEGVAQGVFRSGRNSDETAATVVNAMVAVWHPIIIDANGAEALEANAVALADLLLSGLKIKSD